METTTEQLIKNLMGKVDESSPVDFARSFDTAMKYKCAEMLDRKRVEVAGTIGVNEDYVEVNESSSTDSDRMVAKRLHKVFGKEDPSNITGLGANIKKQLKQLVDKYGNDWRKLATESSHEDGEEDSDDKEKDDKEELDEMEDDSDEDESDLESDDKKKKVIDEKLKKKINESGSKNFFIYTDSEGKMPQLSYKPMKSKSHRYYVQYVNNNPVHVIPYPGQKKVWDYNANKYISIDEI